MFRFSSTEIECLQILDNWWSIPKQSNHPNWVYEWYNNTASVCWPNKGDFLVKHLESGLIIRCNADQFKKLVKNSHSEDDLLKGITPEIAGPDLLDKKSDIAKSGNAMFYIFKKSGKYYAESRGFLPNFFYDGEKLLFGNEERRESIIVNNNGSMPGLSTTGSDFRIIIIPDENLEYGYPICLEPLE